MTKLPVISGKKCVDALAKVGFNFDHQKGSHMILLRGDPFARVSIPNHKTIKKGTLKSIIRQSGLTVEGFIELL